MTKARKYAGLTQAEIAEDIGIGRSTLINYENDNAQPPRHVLIAWALRCGVLYEWLSGEPIFSRAGGIRKARSLTQETRAILYTLAA